MKRVVLLLTVAVVLCLVPLAYTQAAELTGKFTVPAAAPNVTALEIYTDKNCTTPATDMTPQTEYYAKATVSLINKLKFLKEVVVYVYYDSAGNDPEPPGSSNTQTCAILKWTAAPEEWSIDSGSPTTWAINSDNCSRPSDLEQTSGDWIFAFTPGKVATESVSPADWDGKGIATNKNDRTGDPAYVRDKGMNWYGEVTVATAEVDWGTVDPGLLFSQSPNPQTGIGATYIANGGYNATISGTDWDGDLGNTAYLDEEEVEPPTGDNEFALKANDTNEYDSAVWVKTTTSNIGSGTQTTESGNTVNTNTLWLSLSATFEPDVYSGTIYYGIAND